MRYSKKDIEIIRLALAEDIGSGDITTRALVPRGRMGKGIVISKEDGIVSGTGPFRKVFEILRPGIKFKAGKKDGQRVSSGETIISVVGPLDILLTGERSAMNIISHLSGVATLTARYTEAILGYPAVILDTRKTMPGMRAWEKKAVKDGGGANHRMGLYDMYLIKENHISAAGGIDSALKAASIHSKKTGAKIEVEVRNRTELKQALAHDPDYILLDNFKPADLKKAVKLAKGIAPQVVLEASGNINFKNIRKIAAAGVDRISIGKITHSAPVLDLSFMVID